MVYSAQNYCVFGLCSSLGVLKTGEHNVLPHHLRKETDSVSEMLRCLVFRIQDDEECPKPQ
jgi:hypothetical protein